MKIREWSFALFVFFSNENYGRKFKTKNFYFVMEA